MIVVGKGEEMVGVGIIFFVVFSCDLKINNIIEVINIKTKKTIPKTVKKELGFLDEAVTGDECSELWVGARLGSSIMFSIMNKFFNIVNPYHSLTLIKIISSIKIRERRRKVNLWKKILITI